MGYGCDGSGSVHGLRGQDDQVDRRRHLAGGRDRNTRSSQPTMIFYKETFRGNDTQTFTVDLDQCRVDAGIDKAGSEVAAQCARADDGYTLEWFLARIVHTYFLRQVTGIVPAARVSLKSRHPCPSVTMAATAAPSTTMHIEVPTALGLTKTKS